MGRYADDENDYEDWLEAVDYFLEGSHADYQHDHEEAFQSGLTAQEWAEVLIDSGEDGEDEEGLLD